MFEPILATEVAPTKVLHAMRIMNPCRGEFIRLSVNRIKGYFDISYLATEVAPTKPFMPKNVLNAQKNPYILRNIKS